MKKTPFYALKRFFSLLVLDKDISAVESDEKIVQKPEPVIHPLFTQEPKPVNSLLSIKPEELGGREDIDTRVF